LNRRTPRSLRKLLELAALPQGNFMDAVGRLCGGRGGARTHNPRLRRPLPGISYGLRCNSGRMMRSCLLKKFAGSASKGIALRFELLLEDRPVAPGIAVGEFVPLTSPQEAPLRPRSSTSPCGGNESSAQRSRELRLQHFHFWCIQSNRARRGFPQEKPHIAGLACTE
jgi:hypothetical protein